MRIVSAASIAVLAGFVQLNAQQAAITAAQQRSAELEVPRLAEVLAIKAGSTVADVGAGFGAWTIRFSRLVGPRGRVFATDVGAMQLEALRATVARENLTNVTVVEGAARSTNLPAGCCDAILIRDAYHHLSNPDDMARSFAVALRPGGRLAVIDFPTRPNTDVPAGVPANRGGHGVPPQVVEKEVGAVLTHVRTIANWSRQSQPANLFLVLFRK